MSRAISTLEFFEKISSLTKEELITIDGIGEVIADNLLAFFQSEQYVATKTKLQLLTKPVQVTMNDFSLSGEKGIVCITGTFDKSRVELSELLQEKGYQVVTTVTKKTTVLLAGDEAGSKIEKATKLKIRIVSNYMELLS